MNRFTVQMADELQRQLRQIRVSLRASIREQLQGIAEDAAARVTVSGRAPVVEGPPLRFYVSEGYRVSYRVDPSTRSVTVLELRAEST
jgi:mRNA-degrading endonuclease RelE of RelBE toxin-antitoxin system